MFVLRHALNPSRQSGVLWEEGNGNDLEESVFLLFAALMPDECVATNASSILPLESTVGKGGNALEWMRSNPQDRYEQMVIRKTQSQSWALNTGAKYNAQCHQCTLNLHPNKCNESIKRHLRPKQMSDKWNALSTLSWGDIRDWMRLNRLKLN